MQFAPSVQLHDVPADAAYSSDEDEEGAAEDPRFPGRRAPCSDVRITQRTADRRRTRDDEWSDSDDEGLGGRRNAQSWREGGPGEAGGERKSPLPRPPMPMPMPVADGGAAMDANASAAGALAGDAMAADGMDEDGVPGL